MKTLRIIADCPEGKPGDIKKFTDPDAHKMLRRGYAELPDAEVPSSGDAGTAQDAGNAGTKAVAKGSAKGNP
jgi:hypothetical protein